MRRIIIAIALVIALATVLFAGEARTIKIEFKPRKTSKGSVTNGWTVDSGAAGKFLSSVPIPVAGFSLLKSRITFVYRDSLWRAASYVRWDSLTWAIQTKTANLKDTGWVNVRTFAVQADSVTAYPLSCYLPLGDSIRPVYDWIRYRVRFGGDGTGADSLFNRVEGMWYDVYTILTDIEKGN